jgi:hypothetical protein
VALHAQAADYRQRNCTHQVDFAIGPQQISQLMQSTLPHGVLDKRRLTGNNRQPVRY